jgi:pimeloyl-ACP methyl ester carboxylesterase
MKIPVAGGEVAFETAGTGPTILFLHAFPLSSAMWAAQAAALSADHRVVRMDARGFGGSTVGSGPLAMDRIADDAVAVLDHLGVDRAIVCGCSMGGYAAFAFVRRAPARLRALVLVDTKATPDSDEARAGRTTLAQKVMTQGPIAAAEAMLPKLLGATSHRERPEVVARVREWILAAPPVAIANAALGLGERPDSRPTLAAIAVPTLVVHGEEDAVIPVDEARQLNAGIAGSRLVTLPAAGHLPGLEAGPRFDEAVASFLRALGP